eukprot:IDg21429t1
MLQQMVKQQACIELTRDQANRILQQKKGDQMQHLCQYRMLVSFFAALRQNDPEGHYAIEVVESREGEGQQFKRLLVLPSGMIKNWPAHKG